MQVGSETRFSMEFLVSFLMVFCKKTKVIDVISLACVSSESHNLQAVFLSIYDTGTSYPRAAVQNTGVKTFQLCTLTASFEILVDLEMGLTVQSHVLTLMYQASTVSSMLL